MMTFSLSTAVTLFVGSLCLSLPSFATIVQFKTSMGDFEVNLYDEVTPETVSNFLRYVESGSYDNSMIHRSVSSFIVQGGGFYYSSPISFPKIPTFENVVNEPVMSNVRGTIAMAKLGRDPNSATNQWFFNLADNGSNLDNQNGGFTVFGKVTGDGMEIIDAIAALPRYNFGNNTAHATVPVRNYTQQDNDSGLEITENNIVIIDSIAITNSNSDTLELGNVEDGAINNGEGADTPNVNSPNSSGGGSLGFISLLALFAAKRIWRRFL